MILEYLEHIRSRSVAERRRFTWFVSVFITGIIVLIWLSVIFMQPDTHAKPVIAKPAQENSGIFARLRSAWTHDTSDSQAQPEASVAPADLPPEAFGEFKSSFDTATATTAPQRSSTTTAASTTTPSVPTQEEQTEERMVDDVLNEVHGQ